MKEFLKPTVVKIILFLVISPVLWIFSWGIAFRYAGEVAPISWNIIFYLIDPGLMLASKLGLPGGDVVNTLYSLVYWYILSCIIMWLFNRMRRKSPAAPMD